MEQTQNPNNQRRVISLLVDNSNGVLARVASLFCRRGFNIDSLTVSATNDPSISRITVTLRGSEQALSQLILQTERLEVTRQVFELDPETEPAARAAAFKGGLRQPQPRRAAGNFQHLQGQDHRSVAGQHGL